VRVAGGRRRAAADTLNFTVGKLDGFSSRPIPMRPGAEGRARLAQDIVRERLRLTGVLGRRMALRPVGIDALHGERRARGGARLRSAGCGWRAAPRRWRKRRDGDDSSALPTGRPGGGGAFKSARDIDAVASVLLAAARPVAPGRVRGGMNDEAARHRPSRAGDKGDISNISVNAYDARHYLCSARTVTPERVKAYSTASCPARRAL